jgi:endonuclease/exonuclease/phosphatase family metal-dependent hydrolase
MRPTAFMLTTGKCHRPQFGLLLGLLATVVSVSTSEAKVMPAMKPPPPGTVRLATFNAALNRSQAGQLAVELSDGNSVQAKRVAEIIQRVAPDVLVLQEFDWDAQGTGLKGFQKNYLSASQNGAKPQVYPYVYIPPVNTGQPSGLDLDGNGKIGEAGDAFGFGRFPGQYGFVVLSKYPIESDMIRTFQHFLWSKMPRAKLPLDPNKPSNGWYDEKALSILRLSSKNHIDVPVRIRGKQIHLLVSHPTPPVFDGPENRNGLRNFDEIRLWADYISPAQGGYLTDDTGQRGALKKDASFVIMGDLNADPMDGDSLAGAMQQLTMHSRVNQAVARGKKVPASTGGQVNAKRPGDKGNPGYDTAAWGLRVDYVLPSNDLRIAKTGVFWPAPNDPLAYLVNLDSAGRVSSDHRLVWIEIHAP